MQRCKKAQENAPAVAGEGCASRLQGGQGGIGNWMGEPDPGLP
jgi:hypothetical protein